MADKKLTPHKDLFIEEILAEAQALRENDPKAKAEASKAPTEHPKAAAVPVEPAVQGKYAPKTAQTEPDGKPHISAEPPKAAVPPENGKQAPLAPKAEEPTEKPEIPAEPQEAVSPDDIAEQARRALEAQTPPPQYLNTPSEKKKNAKKKGFSLFNRRKRKFAEFEEEDDIYYGLQLKPLEEYRDAYEKAIQMEAGREKDRANDSVFSYLFQGSSPDSVDTEIEKRFERLHSERKVRVEQAIRQAGVEDDDIFSLYESSLEGSEAQPDEPVTEPGQPAVIPAPKPSPVPTSPAPRPEIQPSPVREPEIPQPVTEPSFEPSPAQPASPSPTQPAMPEIRCNDMKKPVKELFTQAERNTEPKTVKIRYRENEEPVKEPVSSPVMKEELPKAPPVKEPPARPAPRMNAPALYRSAAHLPIHMVDAGDLNTVLTAEAAAYPQEKPTQPPEPIHLPLTGVWKEAETDDYKPPIILEQTIEFTPVHKLSEEASQEPELPEIPAEPHEPIPLHAKAEVQPEEPDEETFEETVEEEAIPSKPKKRKGFHLFGNEEEENDSEDSLPVEQDELDDYSLPSDAPSVSHDLGSSLSKMYLRLAVTAISGALLFANGFLGEMAGLLPKGIALDFGVQPYLIVNLVFLFIACAFSITPILNGIKGLFSLQANSDSAVAVASVAALIQSVSLLFSPQSVTSGGLHLYASLVVLALFLNTVGKVSMLKRILKNFRYISAPDQKQAVQLFDDHNTALQMTKGCVIDAPVIAFQTKTNFLKHFLKLSYEPDPSEQSSQTLAPILFISSLVLCIVTLYLSRDVYRTLSAFAAAACISVPFLNMLSINLPLGRLSKIASRCGAMIVGYPAVEQFSGTNAAMVDAKDLFPRGTVILNGIKTFAGQRIDEAIVDATALMCAVGGPLSDLFDQIIQSRRDMLPKIDNTVYEDGKGVSGWVSGRRIFVGNRMLMEAHGIEPPSHDYEEKYINGGKKIVYLASGGDLVAMFVVSYNSDRRRALELRRMEDNGISLVVRTCDPNITPPLLAECFGLDEHCINVLPQRLGEVFTGLTAKPQERTDALMATKGRPTAMMRMLVACVRQRSNITIAVALQNVAVILGFALVAFLTCYSGLQQLSTTALLAYELFWTAAILFVPRIRKP